MANSLAQLFRRCSAPCNSGGHHVAPSTARRNRPAVSPVGFVTLPAIIQRRGMISRVRLEVEEYQLVTGCAISLTLSIMRRRRAPGHVEKVCRCQRWRRTAAMQSLKVGVDFAYQAAWWIRSSPCIVSPWDASVTTEKRPSRQGVVRAIARSDHWRWLSTPRCRRTSVKVTSTCQRRTK